MDKTEVVGDAGITAGGDVSIDNTGQLAIGKYINQFKIDKPSGDELFKLIDLLEQKRKEEFNRDILSKYNLSELPAYLPQLKEFVTHNRADEITKALIYLQDHRILLISGIGGVGKTTLARALVETRPAHVPLPFWFDFSKKMEARLGDVLEKLAGYMNATKIAGFREEKREAGQDDIDKLTGELQRREQLWLIFDNLEIILDDRYFHDQGMDLLFTYLLGSTHNAKIIVTSRVLPLLKNGDNLIDTLDEKQELKGLKLNFAVDYLMKNGLEGLERKKLEELAFGVDGHPLALRLLTELVKKFGISDTLKDLSMFHKRKEDTIKIARRLFDKLAGDEKELLEHLSVFRKPEIVSTLTVPVKINQPTQTIEIVLPFKNSTVIVHDAIKTMFTDRTSEDAVEKLIDKSLLETDHKGNYWLHPLIREFSYNDLKNKKEIHKLACSYYLTLPLPEKRTKKDDVQSLIEAHYHACMAKDYDTAASIIFHYKLYIDLDRWGNYKTLTELCMGVLPKNPLKDEPLLAKIGIQCLVLIYLGRTYYLLGQVDKSIEYSEKALVITRGIGDRHNEGLCLGNIGNAYVHLGQMKRAIEYYEKALAVSKEIGDKQNEGVWLGEIGNACKELGRMEKSIEYSEKALVITKEIGDRHNEGLWLGNIGSAYSHLGDMKRAIEYYEKALVVARETGDKHNEGTWLGSIGNAYDYLGQSEKVIEYCEKALIIAREIGDRYNEGTWLGNIGNSYAKMEQIEKATEYLENALVIAREIGDKHGEGTHLRNLGASCAQIKQNKKAIEYSEKALMIAREIGDKNIEYPILGNLGKVYYNEGKMEKSIEYNELALKVSQEIGNRRDEKAFLRNIGDACHSLGQMEKAIEYYKEALVIVREIGDRGGEGAILEYLGLACHSLGQMEKAIEYYKKALVFAREIGDKQSEGKYLTNLGIIFVKNNRSIEALACCLLGKEVYLEIEDPNIKIIESNLNYLKDKLGEKEFEKLLIEVPPRAEEIVKNILEGTSIKKINYS